MSVNTLLIMNVVSALSKIDVQNFWKAKVF